MRRLAVIVAAAAMLTGCGSEPPHPCTLIGTPVGVGLTVEAPLAAKVRSATLEVCWDGSCRRPRLELFQGSRAGEQTCSGDTCSAVAVPTAEKQGFADVAGLPKRLVEVRLTLRGARGASLLDRTVRVTPKGRFPNGPECGEGGPNAMLTVDGGGSVRES
ncbi:hypothetical protein ABT294_47330 [Nonomuraea sp. NPDC000554]|uniref:hypothetical protein n=1 Tax=Nonomuraea sp. NPDC000554 TaxID=3154259 RepID=UPI00332949DF